MMTRLIVFLKVEVKVNPEFVRKYGNWLTGEPSPNRSQVTLKGQVTKEAHQGDRIEGRVFWAEGEVEDFLGL